MASTILLGLSICLTIHRTLVNCVISIRYQFSLNNSQGIVVSHMVGWLEFNGTFNTE